MLTLSRIPQPRIGSFTIGDDGFLHLANRPLTLMLQYLENEGIPVEIPRHQTLLSVGSYVNALLTCHNNRLVHQPNAVHTFSDAVMQMAALVLIRSVYPHFFDRSLSHGPFVVSLTDSHASNILVDEDWNIKWIIDLEWAASLPVESLQPPEWLTSQAIDVIDVDAYNAVRKEFMEALEEQERIIAVDFSQSSLARTDLTAGLFDKGARSLSSVMHNCWNRSTFWYTMALGSPNGLFDVVETKIEPLYRHLHEKDANSLIYLSEFFHNDAAAFKSQKLSDKEKYLEQLKKAFGITE
jgi:hypothetical protein